jgi:hypothetical protein
MAVEEEVRSIKRGNDEIMVKDERVRARKAGLSHSFCVEGISL